MDRFSRLKISKDIVELNSTINQLGTIDSYWLLHPARAKYTFFWKLTWTFTKRDHILGHKKHLNKFKRTEITESKCSGHSWIKLGINNRKLESPPNIWKPNKILLNNALVVQKKPKEKYESKRNWMKIKTQHTKFEQYS